MSRRQPLCHRQRMVSIPNDSMYLLLTPLLKIILWESESATIFVTIFSSLTNQNFDWYKKSKSKRSAGSLERDAHISAICCYCAYGLKNIDWEKFGSISTSDQSGNIIGRRWKSIFNVFSFVSITRV